VTSNVHLLKGFCDIAELSVIVERSPKLVTLNNLEQHSGQFDAVQCEF